MRIMATMATEIKPKSIGQIYKETGAKWFRVRDITTLRDYLILEFTQVGLMNNDPRWADTISCDDRIPCSRDCREKKYALLSGPDELAYYRRHKKSAVQAQIMHSYNFSLQKSEIEKSLLTKIDGGDITFFTG